MFVTLSILAILWALYLRFRRPLQGEPPVMPGHIPIIGHAYRLIGDTNHLWEACKDLTYTCIKYGGVISYSIGPMKIYVIADPDECVAVANACMDKDALSHKFSRNILGNGLLSGRVPIWKHHRKVLNPAFNQQVLDGFIGVFNKQSRKLADTLSIKLGQGPFNHSFYLRQSALETICLTALGLDISNDSEQSARYVRTFEAILTNFIDRFKRPWLHPDFIYNWSSLREKQERYTKVLQDMSENVLQRKKAEYKAINAQSKNENSTKFKPLMDLLLELEEGTFTDQDIREEVDTIIITGHESTAAVLTYTFLLIGSFPEIQNKIVEELHEVLGKEDRDITKQDLSQLTYLEAVIKESMRFYPISPFITRFIDKDVFLKNCTLRSGHNCALMLYGVHRHPMWGADAEKFRPERWLEPGSLPANPNAFLAFGAGKRNCIGRIYAMMSMKIMVSHVVRCYRIFGDHTKMKLKLDVLMKPMSGHYITVENRI